MAQKKISRNSALPEELQKVVPPPEPEREKKLKITIAQKQALKGLARKRKKSKLAGVINAFKPNDERDIKTYLVVDVIIPTIKKSLLDTLHMFLYGTPSSSKGINNVSATRVNYNGITRTSGGVQQQTSTAGSSRNRVGGYTYENIEVDDRQTGEDILSTMGDIISEFGAVSVADMYDIVDLASSPTDHSYGWESVKSAQIVKISDGWVLKMPKIKPIK